jgi:DNA-binding MarR family transcriptional regulator
VPRRPLPAVLAGAGPPHPSVELANRLNSAAVHLLRRIARDDGVDGVTGARLSALSVLVYGGPQTLGGLARRERVATPTMTRIVDALVRDGLVGRSPVEGDRRAVRLAATDAGRELMERGRARRIERLAGELAAIDPTRLADLARALDVLEQLEATAKE